MTLTTAPVRPSLAARRFGYGVSILVNAVILAAINTWPGWQAIPFLTAEMVLVLPLVNASIVSSVAANAVYIVDDAGWVRAVGNIVTTVIGALALVRMWQVFPFDFGDATFDWALVVRCLIAVGVLGSVIAVASATLTLIKTATH